MFEIALILYKLTMEEKLHHYEQEWEDIYELVIVDLLQLGRMQNVAAVCFGYGVLS